MTASLKLPRVNICLVEINEIIDISFFITIDVSLKGPVDEEPVFVRVMGWSRTGAQL